MALQKMAKQLEYPSPRVVVTGDPSELRARLEATAYRVDWVVVPVLQYEGITIPPGISEKVATGGYQWVIFSSPRGVQYFTDELVAAGSHLPPETRVACVGARTAGAAAEAGLEADICPEGTGTDALLPLLAAFPPGNALIPRAEEGREALWASLSEMGWQVDSLPVYRTLQASVPAVPASDIAGASWICFTSPSSAVAFQKLYPLPREVRVACLGTFTESHLRDTGFKEVRLVPGGKLERLGEIVC